MTRRTRQRKETTAPSRFEQARDELFQHIMRCGVVGAEPEHQTEWFDETMAYLGDRYHELEPKELTDLRKLGERFVQPPKSGPAPGPDAVSAA